MIYCEYSYAAPLVPGCCTFGTRVLHLWYQIALLLWYRFFNLFTDVIFDRDRSCLLNAYRPMPFAKGTSLMKQSCAYFALSACRFYRNQKKNLSFFFFYAPTYDFIP